MSFVRLPRRVMVIGSPGAGKSTLSGQLAQVCGLTPVHLDDRYWQADWTPLDAAAWQAEIIQLTSKATWLIDGNYFPTLPERINRAQAIIFVDTPIVVCLYRVVTRAIKIMAGRVEYLPVRANRLCRLIASLKKTRTP